MTVQRSPVEDAGLLQMLSAMPTAALLTDAHQRIVYLNPAFEQLTGYALRDLAGQNCRILQTAETDPGTIDAMRAALSDGGGFSGEVLNRRRDGRPFWNALRINPVKDADGEVIGFVSSQSEITDQVVQRRDVVERLLTAELLLGGLRRFTSPDPAEVAQAVCDVTVQAGAQSAVLVRSRDGLPHVIAAGGLPVPGLDDVRIRTLYERTGDRNGAGVPLRWITASDEGEAGASLRLVGLERAAVLPVLPRTAPPAALIATWSPGADAEGTRAVGERMVRLAELVGLALDNLALFERIRSAADLDALTGLASRSAVQSSLERALAEDAASAAVLYLDVDRFKRVNDSLGHAAGDALLAQVAQRISTAVGALGTIGRLGGDEFLVVLPGGAEDAAQEAEGRIAAAVRRPFEIAGRTVHASVAVGSAVGRRDPGERVDETATRTVRAADAAMYAAKQRNRAHLPSGTRLDLLALEADLHRALERDQITTWFQPQYDGRTGRLAGFEGLARWRHPSLGWIGPSVFIPLAEEAGLIADIGAHVLRDGVRFADQHAARLGATAMSVNVTRAELLDPAFPDRVATLLRGRRDPSWDLTLEVTELELEEQDGVLRAALTALREHGVGIAIDHFGSGSSSLRMLQDLPVTAVKIDESFFRRTGALGERMIGAIVGLGHGLGLEVMAEGVETAPQLDALRRLGCGRMQGYLLAPPAPSATAAESAPDIRAAERATRDARSSS